MERRNSEKNIATTILSNKYYSVPIKFLNRVCKFGTLNVYFNYTKHKIKYFNVM